MAADAAPAGAILLTIPILERVRAIEGWLSDAEADVLIAAARHACVSFPPDHAIVEIGSYQGRSTVALASVVARLAPAMRVHAIDPHEGEVGAAGEVERTPATLDAFRANLAAAGVAEQVVVHVARSYEVDWTGPIGLLFVDGLHDHESAARDFRHFAGHLADGALVAFHDYGAWPGVTSFVDSLGAGYARVAQGDYMILLRAPARAAARGFGARLRARRRRGAAPRSG
jgi:predicted O-methyltransferase YrrM